MKNLSKYESRIGKVEQSSEKIYRFVTDMRNFNQLIKGNKVENWNADKDKCEFEVPLMGKARLNIDESEEFNFVKYKGEAINNTKFYLWLQLKETSSNDARVKITLKADLNPMLKMMASKPIMEFLEKLIAGIETFTDWDSTV